MRDTTASFSIPTTQPQAQEWCWMHADKNSHIRSSKIVFTTNHHGIIRINFRLNERERTVLLIDCDYSVDYWLTDLIFTVSDVILLGGKHSKDCSECMRKVKSLIPNKLRVIDFLSILWVTRKGYPAESFMVKFEEHRFSAKQWRNCSFNFSYKSVSKFSREMRLAFTDKCMEKRQMKTSIIIKNLFFFARWFPDQDGREIVCNRVKDSGKSLQ